MRHNSEIRTIAELWIERYTDEAVAEARRRLDELKEHGQDEAYTLWLEIYSETKNLVNEKN
jgi:hypothetical protein